MQGPRTGPDSLVATPDRRGGPCASGHPSPDAIAEGQTFTFPWPPEWVARGKYQKTVLRGIIGFNPGQWDVQACGTLHDCLMPSSPQFNGLVYHNPVNPDEIVCDLCESWTVSPDGKTYTFRLRDAQWHDGHPVTAEDIKFSLDRITQPCAIRVRTGVFRTFYEYQSAQVIDDKTVRVPIKFASPLFLENLASEYMKMYSKHATQGFSPEDAQKPGKLIGSGPWKLKEFKPQISNERPRSKLRGIKTLKTQNLRTIPSEASVGESDPQRLNNVIIAIGIGMLPAVVRTVRSQVLSLKEMEYVMAARAVGAPSARIIVRHIMPNCLAIYLILATYYLGFAIIVEASLSFLGVGVPPDVPSWGGMLTAAAQEHVTTAPWTGIFPGLAIFIVVLGFNPLGDALRDVLEPRLRGVRTPAKLHSS